MCPLDHRRALVDPAADLADDPLTDIHQLGVVPEADIGPLDLAVHFDKDVVGAIDHDIGDIVTRQQGFERAEAQHVIADVLEQHSARVRGGRDLPFVRSPQRLDKVRLE